MFIRVLIQECRMIGYSQSLPQSVVSRRIVCVCVCRLVGLGGPSESKRLPSGGLLVLRDVFIALAFSVRNARSCSRGVCSVPWSRFRFS